MCLLSHLHCCSVFLVTVHDPICTDNGDLDAALYGSFLPVPSLSVFPEVNATEYLRENAPGAVVVSKDRIRINQGRERVKLRVTNNGDRPVQVRHNTSSHLFRTRGDYVHVEDNYSRLDRRKGSEPLAVVIQTPLVAPHPCRYDG